MPVYFDRFFLEHLPVIYRGYGTGINGVVCKNSVDEHAY